jgi:hypothetical protein
LLVAGDGDPGKGAIAEAWHECGRALLACAHACLSASFDIGPGGTLAARTSVRACNEVAGTCLRTHRLLMGPRDAPVNLFVALSECAEACRYVELVCHTLQKAKLLRGSPSTACGRSAEACATLAFLLAQRHTRGEGPLSESA